MAYYPPSEYSNDSTDSVGTFDTIRTRDLLQSTSTLNLSAFSRDDLLANTPNTNRNPLSTQDQTRTTQSQIRAAYDRVRTSITSTNTRLSQPITSAPQTPTAGPHADMDVSPEQFRADVAHTTQLIKAVVDASEEGRASALQTSRAASPGQVIALLEQVGRLIALQPVDERESVNGSEAAVEVPESASAEEGAAADTNADTSPSSKLMKAGRRVLASVSLVTDEGHVLARAPVRTYVVQPPLQTSSVTLASTTNSDVSSSSTAAHEPVAQAARARPPRHLLHPGRVLHPLKLNPLTPSVAAAEGRSSPLLSPAGDEPRTPTQEWWQSNGVAGYTGLERLGGRPDPTPDKYDDLLKNKYTIEKEGSNEDAISAVVELFGTEKFSEKANLWQQVEANGEISLGLATAEMSFGRSLDDKELMMIAHNRMAYCDSNRYKADEHTGDLKPIPNAKYVPVWELSFRAAEISGKLKSSTETKNIWLVSNNVVNKLAKKVMDEGHKVAEAVMEISYKDGKTKYGKTNKDGKVIIAGKDVTDDIKKDKDVKEVTTSHTWKSGATGTEGTIFEKLAGTDNNYSYLAMAGRHPSVFEGYKLKSISTVKKGNDYHMAILLSK
ncbi:uncharacterized protein K452DRAFT_339785 [Aplosporella prunicola CBS 121167]|uniref:Uncharacterized protein n=1 Tax=Aplosporella prunicola CBS 121167 TaxID=1176127 RepID=A0A6A6B385_9PEZI|nr:uncharacterized protein K452DRAFT_339785 [Aplosporella prunicola CBS 121167]KAF2137715.1 hypothetical protein K452DRAFT_339785 [Aplosporella prunicola CBS 121167]